MNVYRALSTSAASECVWVGTLAEAHDHAKAIGTFAWPVARVELCDVPTDKASVLLLLAGDLSGTTILKTWKLTPRGALTPCPNGE